MKIFTETFRGFETFPKSEPDRSNLTKKRLIRGRKGKKGKMVSRKSLVRKLDAVVSKIVIKRDESCVLCDSKKQLGAGHIFSRSHYSTRWDLDNCYCQCWSCNFKHKIDPMPYYNWYQKKFGRRKFQALYNRWKEESHYKTKDLENLLKKYERRYLGKSER